jgi:hypothetical protein
MRVSLGHYAIKGFSNPLSTRSFKKFSTIELTDYATIRLSRAKIMQALLMHVMPHPLRYKQVWHFARGDRSLYAWKAVAPENFVALGMICTTTDDEPPVDAMRCVPQKWCAPSQIKPVKIWDDTGAAGGRPGSIWIVNSLDLIAVIPGHDPPKESFLDISSNRFFIDPTNVPPEAL